MRRQQTLCSVAFWVCDILAGIRLYMAHSFLCWATNIVVAPKSSMHGGFRVHMVSFPQRLHRIHHKAVFLLEQCQRFLIGRVDGLKRLVTAADIGMGYFGLSTKGLFDIVPSAGQGQP